MVRDHRAEAVDLFIHFPLRAGDVVMLGDSLTASGDWNGAFPGLPIRNRGISGERARDTRRRIQEITQAKPASVFIMVGTNDIADGTELPVIATDVAAILDLLDDASPGTRVVLQSLLPRSDRLNSRVGELNLLLRRHAADRQVTYIDLHHDFADHRGKLRSDLAIDGVHLNGAGYALWADRLRPVMDLTAVTDLAAPPESAPSDKADSTTTSETPSDKTVARFGSKEAPKPSADDATDDPTDDQQGAVVVDLRPAGEAASKSSSKTSPSTKD